MFVLTEITPAYFRLGIDADSVNTAKLLKKR